MFSSALWFGAVASGCATDQKRAAEFMDAGLFDEALATYEGILQQDPRSQDALIGRTKAREAWIDRKLIEVRLKRMGGDPASGLELLKAVHSKEAEWSMAPSGKVAFTQGEERDYAVKYVGSEVASALSAAKPLRAAFLLDRYGNVLESDSDARVGGMRAKAREEGKKSCRLLQSPAEDVAGRPNLAKLIRAYCQYWGEEGKGPAQAGKARGKDPTAPQLYGDVDVKVAVADLAPEQQGVLREGLRKAFRETAWFGASETKALEVGVTGSYKHTHERVAIERTHVYAEEVPYEAKVEVQKTRSVPFVVQENGASVTKYRDEKYTEIEKVTRYRQVHREHLYAATKHIRNLKLSLAAAFSLGGDPQEQHLARDSESQGIEHDENLPAIGLVPSRPALVDPAEWMRARVAEWVGEFKALAVKRWVDTQCRAPDEALSKGDAGELVARCLAQTGIAPPAHAEQWFRERFGCGVEDSLRLIHYP